jgi:hypothetical protein
LPLKREEAGNRLSVFFVSAEVFSSNSSPGGLSMNSKTVHDIYLEAQAMQREGVSARKIAIRMGTLGAENGLAPIMTIGVGDQIDQHFERTGETIWSDGYDWHYSSRD